MDKQTVSAYRNSAGLVWASLGLAIMTLTFFGVGWIQLMNPVPTEGVFFLLALGGVPATLAMFLGLWRGLRAKREYLAFSPNPVSSPGIRIAGAGIGLLLLGVALFAGDCLRRQNQKRQWMAEAQTAVEEVLHAADRIPADMRERLGPFKDLTTRGLGGPVWNIGAWHFLRTDGEAQFHNGMIPVKIYITRGEKTKGKSQEVVVQKVERNGQLYPFYRGVSIVPTEGLEFWVSHPDFKKL